MGKRNDISSVAHYFSVKDRRLNITVNNELYEKVKEKVKEDRKIGSISDLITLCFIEYLGKEEE